ncbi:hypothetical protein IE077_002433 [Cardiosporidium cionae]|uniref:Uncharacterized protein n=1 Tax=Cardiosporidium cionae TaxID=476202 RepID=A0ABQ7J3R7_9APIC|nr:hypothetical protein IE077_002433 [Cardiosporidium cionae]|eukprot:KAF8817747.1 hypothetical protein IE077_002433 [Cardiosporidium cionae]
MDPLMELALYSTQSISESIETGKEKVPQLQDKQRKLLEDGTALNHQLPGKLKTISVSQQISNAKSLEEARRIVDKYFYNIKTNASSLCDIFEKISLFANRKAKDNTHTSRKYEHPRENYSKSKRSGLSVTESDRDSEPSSSFTSKVSSHFPVFAESISQIGLLNESISQLFLQHPSSFKPEDLCSYMHGLALSGVRNREICNQLAKEIQRRPKKYTIHQLQSIFCSYTRLLEFRADVHGEIGITIHDNAFLKFLLEAIMTLSDKELSKLQTHQLAILLRCLVRLSYKEEKLLQMLGQMILRKQKEFSQKDWSQCVSAYNRFGIPLRGHCLAHKRPFNTRDWEHPPLPKRPKPMSEC